MIRGILIGIVGTLVVLALGLYGGIKMGLMPANADVLESHCAEAG